MKLKEKNGKGIVTDREGTRFSRKASAEQKSPRLKAFQACMRDKTEGVSKGSRSEYQDFFKEKSRECKDEVSL